MSIPSQSISCKHVPNRCPARSAAERVMSSIRKLVKSVSAQIMSKCSENGISQPIKWKIFNVLPIAFLLLMRHFKLAHQSTSYIPPWETEKSQEADIAWKHFCIFFPKICMYTFLRFTTQELAFSFLLKHDNSKWLKTEVISTGNDA